MRNQLRPMFALRRLHRRGHQPKIPPAIVGADEPQPVAMVERVLVLIFARGNDAECAGGVVRLENPRLAGGVAGRLDHDKFAVASAPGGNVEALVVFLVNQHFTGGLLNAIPPQPVLPLLLLVLHGVKQCPIIRGPHHGTNALHLIRKRLAGFEILDAQRVLAKARGVGGVGQPAPVVGNVGVADREKRVALRQLVSVEHNFFGRIGVGPGRPTALAAEDAVLQPLLGARVIPPIAVAVGNGDVGLLHVAQHLLVKLVAQAGQRRHHRIGIGIFGLQVRRHVGILFVAQPGVVVGQHNSVHLRFGVVFAGGGRRGNRRFSHWLGHFSSSVEPARREPRPPRPRTIKEK